jgi:hypothetical protein
MRLEFRIKFPGFFAHVYPAIVSFNEKCRLDTVYETQKNQVALTGI